MKIRTVIMLVAGSALAVPQIARAQDVYPRVEAATYWWRWTREGAEPCANDFAAYEHRDEVSYGPTLLTRTGYWLGDCYASGGWTETWPAPGMPGVGDYWTDGWPPMSDQPIPPFYPEMPFHIGCMVTNWNGGESGYYTDEICESVTVRYVTGHGTPSKPRAASTML